MAVLFVTEYASLMPSPTGLQGQMPQEPALAEQTVAIGAGSVQSSAFNAKTRFIRLHTDAICSVSVDTNPTATATKGRLAANQTEYRGVPVTGTYKVAVITNT